jgi:hypothetical protein
MAAIKNLTKTNPYPERKIGIYGNIGEGENAEILFIETVISAEELDSITLLSNIPDIEKWDVRDLFQRDVDNDRVTNDIIPYFKDKTKIKYFSPITLILLPTENAKRNIIKKIDYIEPQVIPNAKEGETEKIYERDGFYKISLWKTDYNLAEIEWNNKKCYLVAIDGQHRLSGLIRWKNTPGSNFADWKIPVVILNILKVDKKKDVASLLEIVRKTFVYINNKSERINRSKAIMLNDEDFASICTQEIIEFTHQNDVKPYNQRDNSILPLLFFNWQGKVIDKKQITSASSIKSVEEIYTWISEFILPKDKLEIVESELGIDDMSPKLENWNEGQSLSNQDAKGVRKQFMDRVFPGIKHLLENFTPYNNYIKKSREIEAESNKHDHSSHAFIKLRFGSHNAPDGHKDIVDEEYKKIENKFSEYISKNIDSVILQDIGMRGIIYAFAKGKRILNKLNSTTISWLEFSKVFTNILNEIYSENWFKEYETPDLPKKIKEFLTFLIYDDIGKIINYKPQNSKDGLGSLILIIFFSKLKKSNKFKIDQTQFDEVWGEVSTYLIKSYEKGYKREIRVLNQNSLTKQDLNQLVEKEAPAKAHKQAKNLYKHLN